MTNTVPRFISTPMTWMAFVTTANSLMDGTGSFDTILTAPAEGSRVDYMTFQAVAAVSSGRVNIFLSTSNDTEYYWDQVAVSATTAPSNSAPGWLSTLTPVEPLFIPGGWKLKMCIFRNNTTSSVEANVFVQGGDY